MFLSSPVVRINLESSEIQSPLTALIRSPFKAIDSCNGFPQREIPKQDFAIEASRNEQSRIDSRFLHALDSVGVSGHRINKRLCEYLGDFRGDHCPLVFSRLLERMRVRGIASVDLMEVQFGFPLEVSVGSSEGCKLNHSDYLKGSYFRFNLYSLYPTSD